MGVGIPGRPLGCILEQGTNPGPVEVAQELHDGRIEVAVTRNGPEEVGISCSVGKDWVRVSVGQLERER